MSERKPITIDAEFIAWMRASRAEILAQVAAMEPEERWRVAAEIIAFIDRILFEQRRAVGWSREFRN